MNHLRRHPSICICCKVGEDRTGLGWALLGADKLHMLIPPICIDTDLFFEKWIDEIIF